MPTAESIPGAGTEITASAQILQSTATVIRAHTEFPNFGPHGNAGGLNPSAAEDLRNQTRLIVSNLTDIFINVFLFPEYDRGDQTFRARNWIERRPVFRMPSAAFADEVGVATELWLPLANPLIIPVGAPVTLQYCCTGIEEVAIEVRIPSSPSPAANQGEDLIIWSISGSQ